MKFLTLDQLPFSVLHQTFLHAFSDYSVKMEMSEHELANRFSRIAYKPRLSGGILDDNALCAFIFTGLGEFHGKKTAYNGGTGVIPSHRRRQLGTKVYQELLEVYQSHQIEQCLLEVITDNNKAVNLYKSLGFDITRVLKCYAASSQTIANTPASIPLQIDEAELVDWDKYLPFCTIQPSWQNNTAAIIRDINHETILEAYSKTALIGFMSFNKITGKISQLAVSPDFRRAKVGSNLIQTAARLSAKPLAILNVDENDTASNAFFQGLGFGNPLDQYEMVMGM